MGVCNVHMADPVKLLVFSGLFVFLDNLILVIINGGAGYNSRLGAAVHGKLIDIVAGGVFHDKGSILQHGV